MPQLPLFVFGTLRRGECNHGYLAGSYDRVLPARLPGFAQVAPLMIAREANSVVHGELFCLTPKAYETTLSACDRLEELPTGKLTGHEYRRIAARVQTDSGEFIAWVYASPNAESDADLRSLIVAELQRFKHS